MVLNTACRTCDLEGDTIMDPIIVILTALLAAYVPDRYVCTVVDASPAAIEMFCADDRTNKFRFVLIERAGTIIVVDGIAL